MTADLSFRVGMRVRYVPYHAHGDRNHKDCEVGIVTSINEAGVIFVRFGKNLHSEGCTADQLDIEDLFDEVSRSICAQLAADAKRDP